MSIIIRACCRHCQNSTVDFEDMYIEKRHCLLKNKKRNIFNIACKEFKGNINVKDIWLNENNQLMIKWFMNNQW